MEPGTKPAGTRILARSAGWTALAYVFALAAPFLWGGLVEGDGGALIGAVVAGTWTAAPVVAAACFVGASPTRLGMVMFLLLELVLIASFAWVYIDSLFVHWSSMGGLLFFTWPLVQWAAFIVAFLLALLFGWRMRPDFLRDEPPVTPPPRA